MRHLGMLAKSKSQKALAKPLVALKSQWVRAPQSGVLRMVVPLGAQVVKGAIIGRVADPFGEQEQEIRAPVSGIIIGKTNLPLVYEGEAIFHIARFKQPDTATESVEAFQEEHDPLSDRSSNQEPVIV